MEVFRGAHGCMDSGEGPREAGGGVGSDSGEKWVDLRYSEAINGRAHPGAM